VVEALAISDWMETHAMTEEAEMMVYDALLGIANNAQTILASAGTPEAKQAYTNGVYMPAQMLRVVLDDAAMKRGEDRHNAFNYAELRKLAQQPTTTIQQNQNS